LIVLVDQHNSSQTWYVPANGTAGLRLFHCCGLTVVLHNRENRISKQQTKQIRSQASHTRQGLQALISFLMQFAHFYEIFLKKKLVKLELKFYRTASLQTKTTSRDIFEPVLRIMEIC
jgi:predicted transcriptional regulator